MNRPEPDPRARQPRAASWVVWTVLALLGVLLAAWRWAAVAETGTVLSWAGATGWTVLAAVAIVRAVRSRPRRKSDERRS